MVKINLSWLLSWLLLLLCYSNVCALDETTAENLGKLYYAVNPLIEVSQPELVKNFIDSNKSLLQEDSPIIRMAIELGNKLIKSGVVASKKKSYERAYDRMIDMGQSDSDAYAVAQSIQQETVNAYQIGQELLWIAAVVPKAANGDWIEYNSTGTQSRLQLRQIWPLFKQMEMEQTLEQVMSNYGQQIEYQIKFLALMLLD